MVSVGAEDAGTTLVQHAQGPEISPSTTKERKGGKEIRKGRRKRETTTR